jgi:ABC-type branched-subunit amino acid transport system ATPase component
LAKHFGGIHAVKNMSLRLARPDAARADRPERRRQDDGLQPDLGPVRARPRQHQRSPVVDRRAKPEQITLAGIGRSFQITNLFMSLSVAENVRLAVQARHPRRHAVWIDAAALDDVNRDSAEVMRTMGLAGMEPAPAASLSYGGQRLLDMALALGTRPRVLLLDEPLAGTRPRRNANASASLIKGISADLPVLLVEHDIDRVFALADAVTVMNDGEVLVAGTVDDARHSPRCRRCTSASARMRWRRASGRALRARARCCARGREHLLRQEPHPARRQLRGARQRDRRAARPQRCGQVDAAQVGDRRGGTGERQHHARRRGAGTPPAAEIARRGVAYVPQGRGLFAGMSVAENMELGA